MKNSKKSLRSQNKTKGKPEDSWEFHSFSAILGVGAYTCAYLQGLKLPLTSQIALPPVIQKACIKIKTQDSTNLSSINFKPHFT